MPLKTINSKPNQSEPIKVLEKLGRLYHVRQSVSCLAKLIVTAIQQLLYNEIKAYR